MMRQPSLSAKTLSRAAAIIIFIAILFVIVPLSRVYTYDGRPDVSTRAVGFFEKIWSQTLGWRRQSNPPSKDERCCIFARIKEAGWIGPIRPLSKHLTNVSQQATRYDNGSELVVPNIVHYVWLGTDLTFTFYQ